MELSNHNSSENESKASYINKGFDSSYDDVKHPPSKQPTPTEVKTPPLTGPEAKKRKFQIVKNVLAISFCFLVLFTAFSSIANLQSSLNSAEGLGTWTLSSIYGALVVSCMFLPTVVINKLGCKWTIAVCMALYGVHMVANFYATWGTLIPTAFILGLAGAPLWSAKCTYLTQVGTEYAGLTGDTSEAIISRFFGVFFMIFQSSQIWGNLLSSFVLDPGNTNYTITDEQLAICGAAYNNQILPLKIERDNVTIATPPTDKNKIYMLCGIYVSCAAGAVILLSILVDPLIRQGGTAKHGFSAKLFVATFKHMKNYKQILIIPLTIFSGLEQGFITGDFTKGFVTCSFGIHKVGLTMICFGVTDAAGSLGFGQVVKKTGRVPLYLLGAISNVCMIILMLTWKPNPDQYAIFFLIPALWGMSDAIWQTQINAFYGVLFSDNEEAAYSNYRLWESLGFIIAYAYSSYLSMTMKLYFVFGALIIGMVGYLAIEVILCIKKKNSSDIV